MKLSKLILEQDYSKFDKQAEKLAQEIRDTYNMGRYDVYVTMGQYQANDKRFGKVNFQKDGTFPEAEWLNMKNFIQAKGYEITADENYYEVDPGERTYKPYFKFEFDVLGVKEETETSPKISPDQAFEIYNKLRSKLGESFTKEYPIKTAFYHDIK